jgi:hypothetical protein
MLPALSLSELCLSVSSSLLGAQREEETGGEGAELGRDRDSNNRAAVVPRVLLYCFV